MNKYTIPVVGEIGVNFETSTLIYHLARAKDYEAIELQIDSPGGYCDEAEKMIDLLTKSNKLLYTSNIGNVASAATKLFMLPPLANRTFHPERGEFVIHNPWVELSGDAKELQLAAKDLQALENDYAKFYAEKTGQNIDIIKAFMSENKPLTAEQIFDLGFAKRSETTFKAVAYFNLTKMDKSEFEQKLNVFEKFLARFKFKALMLNSAAGDELNFPDINDISELVVGIAVDAADGEHVLPDGRILVVAGKKVTEIKDGATPTDDIEALKAENEALKAELAAGKAALAETTEKAEAAITNVRSEFAKFKAQFSDVKFSNDKPATDKKTIKAAISKDEFEKLI